MLFANFSKVELFRRSWDSWLLRKNHFRYAHRATLMESCDWLRGAWRHIGWLKRPRCWVIVASEIYKQRQIGRTGEYYSCAGAIVVSSFFLVLKKGWVFIGIIWGYFMYFFLLSVALNCWMVQVNIFNRHGASECKLSCVYNIHVCVCQCEFWMKFCHHTVSYFKNACKLW